jgi:lysophospholipase L1-like esterase
MWLRRGAGLALLATGVLVAEVALTLSRTYLGAADAMPLDRVVGDGPPLSLLVLGDSTAAGVGASGPDSTVSADLARALSASEGRTVTVHGVAVSGAQTGDLGGQIARLPATSGPSVALVLIGANDATHGASTAAVRRHLQSAVRSLRARGAVVVLGSCPDLGGARAFPQPLRALAALRGRQVGSAERASAQQEGAAAVDIAALTGPAFRADRTLLASDAFHPSDRGYTTWAAALLPAMTRAVEQSVR